MLVQRVYRPHQGSTETAGSPLSFAFLALSIIFFAVLDSELGVLPGGGGDFKPTPEARVVASVEALSGYLLLGLIVARRG